MKKVLITGASGFVGGFLAEHLISLSSYEISGTCTSDESRDRSVLKDKIQFVTTRLEDKEQTKHLLQETKPEWIFHLAASASVRASFDNPLQTFHTNIDAEINLLDSLRELEMTDTRVLIISSSEVYGRVTPQDIPVDEQTPLRPVSPYAVSKIAQDYLALQYVNSYKMPLVRVRPFQHIGPRQGVGYAAPDFAKQIVEIEKGKREPIVRVGNLEAKRDLTDVRDMVRAYPMLLEKGIAGEVYNVGSGKSHRMQDMLDMMLGLATVTISVEVDPTKLRPSDVPEITADNTKMQALTGWKPEIPLEKTLKDILAYWRTLL